jgi:hypothetical protein
MNMFISRLAGKDLADFPQWKKFLHALFFVVLEHELFQRGSIIVRNGYSPECELVGRDVIETGGFLFLDQLPEVTNSLTPLDIDSESIFNGLAMYEAGESKHIECEMLTETREFLLSTLCGLDGNFNEKRKGNECAELTEWNGRGLFTSTVPDSPDSELPM